MSHSITIDKDAAKATQYEEVIPQLKAVIEGERNEVAVLSACAAILATAFDHFWAGFYLVDEGRNELVLGPFQGPLPCMTIPKGKGVCGTAWEKNQVQLVADVQLYDGHIACSPLTKSEIVLPMHKSDGSVWGVLDIDGLAIGQFDEVDEKYLNVITNIISEQVAK